MLNERLIELRKTLNMSQASFGKTLGVTGTAISRLESGSRNITNQMILLICREFNVDHLWLTTGEGNMFTDINEDDEIIELLNKALSNENEFVRNILKSFAKLDIEDLEALVRFMNKIDSEGLKAINNLIGNYAEITNNNKK